MEVPPGALLSADEKDAAAAHRMDKTGSVVVVESGHEAGFAASVGLVCESIFAAVKSEPGTNSAAAAWLVNEPCSFAVTPVGSAKIEAAVKSLDESGFAAAAPAGASCPASGQPGPHSVKCPVGEEQADEGLKCFEWHMAHCEGSWRPFEAAGCGYRPTV